MVDLMKEIVSMNPLNVEFDALIESNPIRPSLIYAFKDKDPTETVDGCLILNGPVKRNDFIQV